MSPLRTITGVAARDLIARSHDRRRDPAAALPEWREWVEVRAPRIPASPGSAKLRKLLARPADLVAQGLRRLAHLFSRAGFEIEGQPLGHDALRADWHADFEARSVTHRGFPWADEAQVARQAGMVEMFPALHSTLSPEMCAAIERRRAVRQ